MKTLSKFGAKSISGSGDIDRGHKKPPPQTYKGQKSPGLIGLNKLLKELGHYISLRSWPQYQNIV